MDFLDERMNLPIQGVSIDWDKIDGGSYLREIEAIKGLDCRQLSDYKDVY